MIASNDPLRDDGIRFTWKLAKLGVDVELKELNLMPHGFLSYNLPVWGMKEESLKGVKIGTNWLLELVDDQPSVNESFTHDFSPFVNENYVPHDTNYF